jgi:peptide deformylase
MSDMEILTVDDPEQLKILRSKSSSLPRITPAVVNLAQRMLEVMHEANGAGLAAPQVGVLQRFFVVEIPEDEDNPEWGGRPLMVFNPKIIKSKGEQVGLEGCLSIPGYIGEVARSEEVTVKALDERGNKVRYRVRGFLARVFEHEIDHLEGVLYTDRLTDPATFQPVPEGEEEAAELEAAFAGD